MSPHTPLAVGRVSDARSTRKMLQDWKDAKNSQICPEQEYQQQYQPTFSYSPASKVPQKMETRANREGNTTVAAAQVLHERLPKLANVLDESTDACREWLSSRVLTHVASLVKQANAELEAKSKAYAPGEKLVVIGEDNLAAINYRHAQLQRRQQLAYQQTNGLVSAPVGGTVAKVIRYLSVHENQKYLVSRIAGLADDSCLSDYQHNGGETGKRKLSPRWTDECPTDAQILVHCFCCYMDEHAYTHSPVGDPLDSLNFTRLHFVKEPDSLASLQKRPATTDTYIYQSSIRPPHFQIATELEDGTYEIWDLKPGRKNLFHAIVVFMYHVCQGSHTKLDEYAHTSLGHSGLNIVRLFRFSSYY